MSTPYKHHTKAEFALDSPSNIPTSQMVAKEDQKKSSNGSAQLRTEKLTEALIKSLTQTDSIVKLTQLFLNRDVIQMNFAIRQMGGFNNMMNLRDLDLCHNEIERIENLTNLKQLRVLRLSYNRIPKIENISVLKNLETLELTHNLIDDIPTIIGLNKQLSHLNLAFNSISKRDCILNLRQCNKLHNLSLIGNPVSEPVEYQAYVLSHMRQLRSLDDHVISVSTANMYKRLFISPPVLNMNKEKNSKQTSILQREDQINFDNDFQQFNNLIQHQDVSPRAQSAVYPVKKDYSVEETQSQATYDNFDPFRRSHVIHLETKAGQQPIRDTLRSTPELENNKNEMKNLQGYEDYTDNASLKYRKGDNTRSSVNHYNQTQALNENSLFAFSESNADLLSSSNTNKNGGMLNHLAVEQNQTEIHSGRSEPYIAHEPFSGEKAYTWRTLKGVVEVANTAITKNSVDKQSSKANNMQEKNTPQYTTGANHIDKDEQETIFNDTDQEEEQSQPTNDNDNQRQCRHGSFAVQLDGNLAEVQNHISNTRHLEQIKANWAKAELDMNELRDALYKCKQDADERRGAYATIVKQIENEKEKCLGLMKQLNSWMESRINGIESNKQSVERDNVRLVILNERSELISKIKEFLSVMDSEMEYHMNYFLLSLKMQCERGEFGLQTNNLDPEDKDEEETTENEQLSFDMIVKELDNNQVRLDLLTKQFMHMETTFNSSVIAKYGRCESEEENKSVYDLFKQLQESLLDLQEKERLRLDMFFHIKNQYSLYEELIQAVKEQKETVKQLKSQLRQYEQKKTDLKNKTDTHNNTRAKEILNAPLKNVHLSSIQSDLFPYEHSLKNEIDSKMSAGHSSQKPPRAQQRSVPPVTVDSQVFFHENNNVSNISFETMQAPGTLNNFFSQSISELQNHLSEGSANHQNVQTVGLVRNASQGQGGSLAYLDDKRDSADWNISAIRNQNYMDYYESYPQSKKTQDGEKKHKNSDADDSSTKTLDNTPKSQCPTPQLPQLGSHSSSIVRNNTECQDCFKKKEHINELTIELNKVNKDNQELEEKVKSLVASSNEAAETYACSLREQSSIFEEKLREANADKVTIGQELQGLITQSEDNAAKIVELKNRLNSVLQEHIDGNIKIQVDLPWILRAQADIIESLVSQRSAIETQYQGSLSMSRDLLANREILNKAKESHMNTSKHSHQRSSSNQVSSEAFNTEEGLHMHFLACDESKNMVDGRIKLISKNSSPPDSQSAFFTSHEDSQEQFYLLGSERRTDQKTRKIEGNKPLNVRSDDKLFSNVVGPIRPEEYEHDLTSINNSNKHEQIHIPQLNLPKKTSDALKQMQKLGNAESMFQYDHESTSNVERIELVPPLKLSNIHKRLLGTSQSHINQQQSSRLTFAEQRQLTIGYILPNQEAKNHMDIEKPINPKTLDTSLSGVSAHSGYSKFSSPHQRLPLSNGENHPSFMSTNSQTERIPTRYYSLNRALFGNKSYEKENISKSHSEISQIMSNNRRDDFDEHLAIHPTTPQNSTRVFNRAAGAIPCLLSNLSENLAQNMMKKTPVKPKSRLLNVHKNIVNYKSLKDKLVEKKELARSASNLDKSCNLSRYTPDITPNKFAKLLDDIAGNSARRMTSLTARQTPLTNRTVSSQQHSNVHSGRSSFRNAGSLSSRAPIDHKMVFRRPSNYHQDNGREISVNLKSFLEHKRKLFHTSDVVHYNEKFDMVSPYHPMYTNSMLDLNNNSHNASHNRMNISQI